MNEEGEKEEITRLIPEEWSAAAVAETAAPRPREAMKNARAGMAEALYSLL